LFSNIGLIMNGMQPAIQLVHFATSRALAAGKLMLAASDEQP
jgi:hypothetical protein